MNESKLRFKADDRSQFPDWEEKKVGSLGNIVGGGTPSTKKKEYWCGKMAWVSSADICDNDIYNINMTRFITQDAIDDSATKIVPKDSILIVSRVGVGKVAKASCDLCTSQDFTNVVNPDGDATFLSYAILRLMQSKLQCVQGTSIKGIPSDEIKNYMLRIPCLAEQQKIAEFLSTIDTVIEKQKETVSAWEERKKGVMQKLFSQEVRFKADDGSDFPEWEKKKIGDVCEQTKETIDPMDKPKNLFVEYSMPAYDNEMKPDIVYGNTMNSIRKVIRRPCVLINKLNVRKRRIWNVTNPENNAVCSAEFVPLTSDVMNLTFVTYFALTDWFTKYLLDCSTGSSNSQKRVTPDVILNVKMPVPCLAEQKKIADCLSSLDEVIEKQKATLTAWEELKKGLLQQMFV